MVSCLSLVQALRRLHSVRELGIKLPAVASIPAIRIAALARFAGTAKVSAILRLQNPRRLATLVAFMHCLEATAQDDALEVLELLLRELFGNAIKADKKARQLTMKDLDQFALTLAKVCQMVLDNALPDAELRARLFEKIPCETLTQALDGIKKLIRPADNVYFKELDAKYRTVRRFLSWKPESLCRSEMSFSNNTFFPVLLVVPKTGDIWEPVQTREPPTIPDRHCKLPWLTMFEIYIGIEHLF